MSRHPDPSVVFKGLCKTILDKTDSAMSGTVPNLIFFNYSRFIHMCFNCTFVEMGHLIIEVVVNYKGLMNNHVTPS